MSLLAGSEEFNATKLFEVGKQIGAEGSLPSELDDAGRLQSV